MPGCSKRRLDWTNEVDRFYSPVNLSNMTVQLRPEPLTQAAFSPFGDVIELAGAEHFPINKGFTERYHDLAEVDVSNESGIPLISIFRGKSRPQPISLDLMERHPLGTQAFYPLQEQEWLIVVSSSQDPTDIDGLRAFRASGQQGVSYSRSVWHHPLLVLVPEQDFLIVDRGGPGNNLEEVQLYPDVVVELIL